MAAPDDCDLAIVSDFHLSAGADPATGLLHPNEDFFADAAFARLLDHLLDRGRRESRRWRLVILGDFVDFLQVELRPEPGGATAVEACCERLTKVAEGHPEVFAALGRWLAVDQRLDVVVGNHDVELIWPAVQDHFRQLVDRHAPGAGARIAFHPWIFYLPGVVFAEHGHQYDAVNSFLTPLTPFLPDRPELIELPLGSFFVRYLFNHLERVDPFADNLKPVTRYLSWALRSHPILTISRLPDLLRLFVQALRKTAPMTEAARQARRRAYRDEAVNQAAATIGLPPEILVAIDALAAVPTVVSPLAQTTTLVVRPLLPAALAITGAIAAYRALGRLPSRLRSWRGPAVALAALIWREWPLLHPGVAPDNDLLATAARIDGLLREADRRAAASGAPNRYAVPAYVFGHTHRAEQYPLGDGDEAPRYLNSGTWTTILPAPVSLLGVRDLLTYVEISRDPRTGTMRPRLLIWNDTASRADPLRREPLPG